MLEISSMLGKARWLPCQGRRVWFSVLVLRAKMLNLLGHASSEIWELGSIMPGIPVLEKVPQS